MSRAARSRLRAEFAFEGEVSGDEEEGEDEGEDEGEGDAAEPGEEDVVAAAAAEEAEAAEAASAESTCAVEPSSFRRCAKGVGAVRADEKDANLLATADWLSWRVGRW